MEMFKRIGLDIDLQSYLIQKQVPSSPFPGAEKTKMLLSNERSHSCVTIVGAHGLQNVSDLTLLSPSDSSQIAFP